MHGIKVNEKLIVVAVLLWIHIININLYVLSLFDIGVVSDSKYIVSICCKLADVTCLVNFA